MTVYLAPCGISVLGGLKRSRGAPYGSAIKTAKPIARLIERFTELVPDGAPGAPIMEEWNTAFPQVEEQLRLGEWDARVCAETSTLLARRDGADPQESVLFEPEDSVVLLASDTTRGLVAALLVATRIAGCDMDSIHYAETPGEAGRAGTYPIHPGTVTVVRVRGLDPRADDAFTRAAWGTGDVMRAACDAPAADTIDVHLSGGFKAVLLHTLALTEVLRSHDPGSVTVTACYLYEDEDASGSSPDRLIEVGLRRVAEGTVRTMRDELLSVRDGKRLDSADFEGVAWEAPEGGQPRLNAFGHGFLAILGNPTETTSDAARVR